MNKRLSDHPLVELIHEAAPARVSGALRLMHERIKAVIYLEAGAVVYAASNLRAHRLAEVAKRWHAATDAQLAKAAAQAPMDDAQLAQALIKINALSVDELETLVARQTSDVLRLVLLWTSGEWSFDARAKLPEQASRVMLDAPELLMESARRLPLEFTQTRFPHTNEMIFPEASAAATTTAVTGVALLPVEAFVLSRVDAPLRIHELTAVCGLPEAETLRAIYALALGNLLRREAAPRVFTPEVLARIQAMQAAAAPSHAAAPAASVKPEIPTPPKAAPPAEEIAPVNEALQERRALDELFARLDAATDHYAVLGIGRRAAPDEIKRIYYSLAKRFHPDRFHHDADQTLHTRVEAAFTRIAQAYETLRDKSARAAYDLKIESSAHRDRVAATTTTTPLNAVTTSNAPPNNHNAAQHTSGRNGAPSDSAATPPAASSAPAAEAEEYFRRGTAAFDQGNRGLAIACFSEAVRLAPKQARYRAHYGRALAGSAQTKHKAEAEMRAAVALDERNASLRVMLAEFYRNMGMQRRAEGELERALAIDPQSDAARALLAALRSQPTAQSSRQTNVKR